MIVLDTHAWVWWLSEPRLLSSRARRAIEEADVVGVPGILCYEVARLAIRGRINLHRDIALWISQALNAPNVELLELSPRIAITAAQITWEHGDPIDQLIVATAVAHNAPLVSKDDRIRLFKPARAIW